MVGCGLGRLLGNRLEQNQSPKPSSAKMCKAFAPEDQCHHRAATLKTSAVKLPTALVALSIGVLLRVSPYPRLAHTLTAQTGVAADHLQRAVVLLDAGSASRWL